MTSLVVAKRRRETILEIIADRDLCAGDIYKQYMATGLEPDLTIGCMSTQLLLMIDKSIYVASYAGAKPLYRAGTFHSARRRKLAPGEYQKNYYQMIGKQKAKERNEKRLKELEESAELLPPRREAPEIQPHEFKDLPRSFFRSLT